MIAVALTALLGGMFYFVQQDFSMSYQAETKEVIVDNTPEWANDPEAIEAAKKVIERKRLEAELDSLQTAKKEKIDAHNLEIKELDTQITDIQKALGSYWRDPENVKALIRSVFKEDPSTAVEVARRESQFIMQQSKHRYTARNVPEGYSVGDREQSFCVFQIHAPVHDKKAQELGYGDYRTNIESCVKMAYVIYQERGFHPWSVYKDILAMR